MACRNIFYLDEVNNLAKTDKELLVRMSEEMYSNQINELVEDALTKPVKILLVAGPSSSGKTTTSNLITKTLQSKNKKSLTISLDDFFYNREKTPRLPNGKYDFENITAIDLDYFNEFINDLFTTNHAKMPIFDFVEGRRKPELVDVSIDENTYLIIEGLHALNPTLLNIPRENLYKIYICVQSNFILGDNLEIDYTNLRLMRRFNRDYYTRGRTLEGTLDSWDEVLIGEKLYIDPYKDEADYNIDSTLMYEPLLFANYLKPLLKKSDLPKIKEVEKMLENCSILSKDIIPSNSLL
ncbi:MAG: Flp pilus assembly complex ATPase component TadA, partial [Clostridia bacterium]|nr:Flp pilus assembly complex ATPase component TadA [Clostridia bacterium]